MTFDDRLYESEAAERWGDTEAYAEFSKRGYSREKLAEAAAGLDAIMGEFAGAMSSGESPDSPAARALVRKLRDYITQNYYACTDKLLFALGETYVSDGRFKANIDRHADGTAEFIRSAIALALGR